MKRGRRAPALLALVLLLALLAAQPGFASPQVLDAGHKVFIPLMLKPFDFGTLKPNPVSVSISQDSNVATATIDAETGGTLTATGSNGATYTLEVPADALLVDTIITMKPIRSASGLPYGGQFRAGVQLTAAVPRTGGGSLPAEDLRFYKLAKLTMTSPVAVPPARQWAWASQSGGQHVHSYPLALGTPAIQFHLAHFSEYYFSEVDPIRIVDPKPVPGPTEAQLAQALADLLREERWRQLVGEDGDPNIWSKVEEILRAYYAVAIAPKLPVAEQDCDEVEWVFGQAHGWSRQVELLGLGDTFAPEIATILASHGRALENCWQEITEPCLNQTDAGQMSRATQVARTAQLLGMDSARFNPFTTTPCDCSGVARVQHGWTASVRYTWEQSASGPLMGTTSGHTAVTTRRTANVSVRLTADAVHGPTHWGGPLLSGSAEVFERRETDPGQYDDGYWRQWEGSGTPRTAIHSSGVPNPAYFQVSHERCTYTLSIPIRLDIRETDSDGLNDVGGVVVGDVYMTEMPLRWTAEETRFRIDETRSEPLSDQRYRGQITTPTSLALPYMRWLNGSVPRVALHWTIEPTVPPPPTP